MRKLAVDQTTDVLVAAKPAIDREDDVEFIGDALPAQLLMIAGFLESSPHNEALLALASQAFSEYAFGFVEDAMEDAAASNPDRATQLRHRARALYLRGMRYGLQLLAEEDDRFPTVFDAPEKELRQAVSDLGHDAVPGLFWTGFGLAGAINVGKDEPALIAQLPKVEVFMKRVEALDVDYHFSGPLVVLGAYWASRTQLFGGDLQRGRGYFERAIARHPKFLMTKVMFARTYAVQSQDRAFYEKLLQEVVATSADVMPTQRLANMLAHRRASRYLGEVDDLF